MNPGAVLWVVPEVELRAHGRRDGLVGTRSARGCGKAADCRISRQAARWQRVRRNAESTIEKSRLLHLNKNTSFFGDLSHTSLRSFCRLSCTWALFGACSRPNSTRLRSCSASNTALSREYIAKISEPLGIHMLYVRIQLPWHDIVSDTNQPGKPPARRSGKLI